MWVGLSSLVCALAKRSLFKKVQRVLCFADGQAAGGADGDARDGVAVVAVRAALGGRAAGEFWSPAS